MSQSSKISSGQLFLFALLSRVIITLAYGINAQGHTITNGAWFACLVLPLALFVLGIPTLYFVNRFGGNSICDYAFTLGKKTGITVSVAYALLFFALSFSSVGRFSFFVTSTVQANQSVWFFPLLMMSVVCIGAIKGLRAIFRAGAILVMLCILSILIILVVLIPRFEMLNIISPFYDGAGSFWYTLTMLTFSSMEMGTFLMLAPMVKGKITKTYIGYTLVSGVFLFVIFFTILAVLGEYAALQTFPFYSVAGVAQMGELSNLSALQASVWMIGVFFKSAVYLHLCYDCISFFIPKRHRSISLVGLASLGAVSAALTAGSLVKSKAGYNVGVIIVFNLLFSVVIPLFVIGIGKMKRRKQRETNAVSVS